MWRVQLSKTDAFPSLLPCGKPLRMLLLHFPRQTAARSGRGTRMGVESGGGLVFDPE